ncbi:MAG TPA: hypothetical protein VG709_03590, partial [Actinomycetota bacterium]|nr:hypothetical protein [Actinomycetota bacterium]
MSGREQRRARLAWSLWGLVVLLTSIAIVFLVLAIEVPLPEDAFGFRGFGAVWALVYATFGALVASRQPRNAIGWLFLGVGITSAVQELCQEYAMYSLLLRTGDLPAGAVAAWVTAWIWVPMVWAGSAMVFLLFPDGRLPSPAWRPVAFVSTASMAIATLGFAVIPGEVEGFIAVRNPFGVQLPRAVVEAVSFGALMLFVATVVASVVALLRRFRRATGDERQQVKWVVAAASLLSFVILSGLTAYAVST